MHIQFNSIPLGVNDQEWLASQTPPPGSSTHLLAMEYFLIKKCLVCIVTGMFNKINAHAALVFIQTYFYCCPFHRNHTSSGSVIIFILQISRHAKVSNLKIVKPSITINVLIYLAFSPTTIHQDVPGSKVSMYKALLGQVLHTRGNLKTVPQQLLR